MFDILFSDSVLGYIIYIVLVLLVGSLLIMFSKKMKISNAFIIVLFGILIGCLHYNYNIINLPLIVIQTISIIALALLVFDESSKLKLEKFDTIGLRTISMSLVFFILMIIVFSLTVWYVFGINFWYSLIFSCLMMSTNLVLTAKKTRICDIIEVESVINNLIALIIPFALIQISYKLGFFTKATDFYLVLEELNPWGALLLVGIGAGLMVGLISAKIVHKHRIESKLSLMITALIAYFLAEILNGSGIIAVFVTGFIYAGLYLKHKIRLCYISGIFISSIEILVLFLAGSMIKLPITADFLYKSAILFLVYLLLRYISIHAVFVRHKIDAKEKLLLLLNAPKGIIMATVLLFLSVKIDTGLTNLVLAMIIYSIIASWFSKSLKCQKPR